MSELGSLFKVWYVWVVVSFCCCCCCCCFVLFVCLFVVVVVLGWLWGLGVFGGEGVVVNDFSTCPC